MKETLSESPAGCIPVRTLATAQELGCESAFWVNIMSVSTVKESQEVGKTITPQSGSQENVRSMHSRAD